MKRVLTAVVLIPLVMADVFLAPDWVVVLTVGIVALLAANEYLQIAAALGSAPYRRTVLAIIALGFLDVTIVYARVPYFETTVGPLVLTGPIGPLMLIGVFFLPLLFLVMGLRKHDLRETLGAAAVSYLTFFYIVFPLGALVGIWSMPNGPLLLATVLIVVWAGDVAAMYAGRAIGRHKLAPRVSPGKTVEGSIASLVFAVIVCWALLSYVYPRMFLVPCDSCPSPRPPWWLAVLLGVGLNLAAQLGDLVESAIKRGAGVKDSGTLLPGHGGVLDRIDALLLAAPVGMLILVLTRDYFSR